MNYLNRRDFLRLAGITAGGIAVSSIPDLGTTPLALSATQEADFQLFVSPSGTIEVLTRTGISLGTFPTTALDRLATPVDPVDDKTEAMKESADIARLLANLPEPLVPIALHPLTTFQSLETGYSLGIHVLPKVEPGKDFLPEEVISGIVAPNWDYKTFVGDYFIRVSIEKHFLGSCIRRNVWHAGALVRHVPSNTMVFNLHVASWWDTWKPCFAVYESKRGFCWNVCRYPTWDAIVAIIYAAIAAGIVWWLAWAVAGAIATGVVGALTVIPGVPPPP